MGLHGMEKLFHSKGNDHHTEEVAHRVRHNLCQLYIQQAIITRICKVLRNLNSKRISDPIKKSANELNRAWTKKEVQMAKST
jgi:hypothetical protein